MNEINYNLYFTCFPLYPPFLSYLAFITITHAWYFFFWKSFAEISIYIVKVLANVKGQNLFVIGKCPIRFHYLFSQTTKLHFGSYVNLQWTFICLKQIFFIILVIAEGGRYNGCMANLSPYRDWTLWGLPFSQNRGDLCHGPPKQTRDLDLYCVGDLETLPLL